MTYFCTTPWVQGGVEDAYGKKIAKKKNYKNQEY